MSFSIFFKAVIEILQGSLNCNEMLYNLIRLLIAMSSLYGLSEFDHFNNITLSHPDFTAQTMQFSPSGQYMLILRDDAQVAFYNANTQTQIPHSISEKIYSIAFQVTNEDVVYSTGRGIVRYNFIEGTFQTLLQKSADNIIYSLAVSADYRSLYYTNDRFIKSMDLTTKQTIINQTEQDQQCLPRYIYVNRVTEDIVTAGVNCQICRWRASQDSAVSLQAKQTGIEMCQTNSVSFIQRQIVVQNSYNLREEKHARLNPSSLQILGTTSQAFTNTNKAYLLPVQNYMISYAGSDSKVWIYRNLFTQPAAVYDFKDTTFVDYIKSIGYNPAKKRLIVSAIEQVNPGETLGVMTSMQLSFFCPEVIGSSGTEQTTECPCRDGYSFNKAEFSCQAQSSNLVNGVMVCPHRQSFNTFDWQCQLDCSKVSGSAASLPFGTPSQCYCASPRQWNFASRACSYIDCSKIPHSAWTGTGYSCSCQSGYSWSSFRMGCVKNAIPSATEQSSAEHEHAGLAILVIFWILIGLALVCVIIKTCCQRCRQERQHEERKQQQKRQEPQDTDRQLQNMAPPPLPNYIQTAQNLNQSLQKQSPATQAEHPDDDLDRFSITDDEQVIDDEQEVQEDPQMSDMASNMDHPLQ